MIKRAIFPIAISVVTFATSLGAYTLLVRPASHGPHDLGNGVTVSIEDLTYSGGSAGRMFLARIKLDPTQLDLFLTPPDPTLDGSEFMMRLAHTQSIAQANNLKVATNACLFVGGSFPLRRAGQRCYPMETTVSNGKTIHLWEHTYMIGFLPDLTPQPQPTKPPPQDQLAKWKWGIGHQGWALIDGRRINEQTMTKARSTAVALNPATRELYLAVFDAAPKSVAITELSERGATWAAFLDGSESSTFVVDGVALTGDWRPVANHFGIKVQK